MPVEVGRLGLFRGAGRAGAVLSVAGRASRALHTMRSFTGVLPGERRGCVGCHSTAQRRAAAQAGLALTASADRLEPAALGRREHRLRAIRSARAGPLLRQVPSGRGRGPRETGSDTASGHRGFALFKEPYLTLIGPAAWPVPAPEAGPARLRHGRSVPGLRLAGRTTSMRTIRPPTGLRPFTGPCVRCGTSPRGAH